MDLNLYDDQLDSLRATLLATGKGRRPSLPPLTRNNRLIYQLHLLAVESKASHDEVAKWFTKLFPSSAYQPNCFGRHIQRVADKVDSLKTNEEKAEYLSCLVEFDHISDTLTRQGVDRHLDFSKFIKCVLTNEMVHDLHSFFNRNHLTNDLLWKTACALSSAPVTLCKADFLRYVKALSKKHLQLKKRKDAESLQQWHSEEFRVQSLPCTQPRSSESAQPAEVSLQQGGADISGALVPPSDSQSEPDTLPSLDTDASSFCPAFASSPKHSCTVPVTNQRFNRLQQQFADKCNEVQILTAKLETVTDMFRNEQTMKEASEKEKMLLKSKTTLLTEANSKLEAEVHNLRSSKAYKTNGRLRKEIKKLQETISGTEHLQEKIKMMEAKVVKLKAEKQALQTSLSKVRASQAKLKRAKEELDVAEVKKICSDSSSSSSVNLRIGRRYSYSIRRTVIALQSKCSVSASQCSRAIQVVANELFGMKWNLSELPSEQTLRDISDEAHVLSKMLTAEQLQHNDFTLHVDGTSRDQRKFIGHQVTLDSGVTLSLGFTDVATEDAATLLDVTVGVLRELGDIYDSAEQDRIFQEILRKLKCTMTDRASVMKKFAKDLNATRQETLGDENIDGPVTFLFCNAHFLLGLSSSCEEALKGLEKSLEKKLGRDAHGRFAHFRSKECAASRFIRTACAIFGPRGDQKSGCRVEWLAFCEQKEVCSRLPSYRSNRFNCYFEGAARLIENLPTIREFLLGNFLCHDNLLIDSVRKDATDDDLIAIVVALGLVFIHFTGPFWMLLQSKATFLDFPVHVQGLYRSLCTLESEPSPILSADFTTALSNIFPVSHDLHSVVYAALSEMEASQRQILLSSLQVIMRSSGQVCQRQMGDFLEGGAFQTIPSHLKHCPLTNLVGENAFGDFDFQKSKHRHASLFHHSSIHMAKANKVSDWLNMKTDMEKTQLMTDARKSAKALRRKHRIREKEVIKAVRQKMMERAAAMKEREIKAVEVKKKLIEEVMAHGGECRTTEDVECLKASLDPKAFALALKNEIRYQKVILGVPGLLKLSKPATELKKDLCNHLRGVEAEEDDTEAEEDDIATENEGPDLWQGNYEFSRPGQWVAVFYDDQLYIGQVMSVVSSSLAEIKFVEQTKTRDDYFRWPRTEDIAMVESKFVFGWDFDLMPVTNDCRIWSLDCLPALKRTNDRIKTAAF